MLQHRGWAKQPTFSGVDSACRLTPTFFLHREVRLRQITLSVNDLLFLAGLLTPLRSPDNREVFYLMKRPALT